MGKTGREQKSREVIKDPIHERTRVVIVGGGIGGLAAASSESKRVGRARAWA